MPDRCSARAQSRRHGERASQVAFYDRVLVLGHGAVQEYDSPLALLQRAGGVFQRLAEESGDLESLKQAAEEAEGLAD